MPTNRIAVVGSSGAGKTTLACAIEAQMGLPRLELDAVFHQANWEPLEQEAFKSRVTAFMDTHDSWVIDGNYEGVTDLVWDRATTVLWIHPPRWRVMFQVISRTVRRFVTRKQLWNGNREPLSNLYSLDPEHSVIVWAWRHYPGIAERYRNRFQNPRWKHVDYYKLRSRRAARTWLMERL